MCCQLLRFLIDWLIDFTFVIFRYCKNVNHKHAFQSVSHKFTTTLNIQRPIQVSYRHRGFIEAFWAGKHSKINLAQTQPSEARAALWLRLLLWRSGSGPYPCEKSSMALTWSLSLEVMSWLLASSTVLLTALDRRSSSLVELVVATSSMPVLITCPITTGKTNNSCLFFLDLSTAAVLMGKESHALVKFCLWTQVKYYKGRHEGASWFHFCLFATWDEE